MAGGRGCMALLLAAACLQSCWASSAYLKLRARGRAVTAAPRLHVVAVSTLEQQGGEQIQGLLESCTQRWPNITVLGASENYTLGHTTKVLLMLQHLKQQVDGEDLVLFLDSDLRCFPCDRDPVKLFLAQSADLVVAADFDGFPDFAKERMFPPVPPGLPPLARRYINSGTYIGQAKHVQALLARYVLQQAQHLQQQDFHDQRLWQDAYLAQYYSPEPTGDPTIAVDHAGLLFQTFDDRDTCWQQSLPGRQVACPLIYPVDACILHTAGRKRFFYEILVPRWLANETNLNPAPHKGM